MLKCAEKRTVIDGRSLLEQLAEFGAETRSFALKGDACEEFRQRPAVALRTIQRLEKQLDLQGRLAGGLKDAAPTVNVFVSKEKRFQVFLSGLLRMKGDYRAEAPALLRR